MSSPQYPDPQYPQQQYPDPQFPQQQYLQQQYPQAQYPQQAQLPGYPGVPQLSGVGEQRPLPARPATIVAAFWCWLGATALWVLGPWTFFLLHWNGFVNGTMRGSGIRRTDADTGFTITVAIIVVALAALAVPFVIAAVKLRAGRRWAQILLAILGGLGVVVGALRAISVAFGMSSSASEDVLSTPVDLAIAGIILLSTVAALVLTFLPPSNQFVAAANSFAANR
ncbi:hypothetical protein F0L68_07120 [Solihabitans fulvus]|uniref:Uncharacterized protein n=1 Tax=Solihabitans fulvus TaxID=1892852 RepID=A0A5B2XPF3_9PSEU|nr:hypothetical protein [Solihabitans fulvus]KAA2264840.1 hypothetical protein F0L68_07120 [Solihabitans fulvus]